MNSQVQNETKQYYCPFCSQEIIPEEVLFVDNDWNIGGIVESEHDPQRFEKLESRVLRFTNQVTADGKKIELQSRPIYRYHRWHKPTKENLPWQEPIEVNIKGNSPFPEKIKILRGNGLTPKQLMGAEKAPWENETKEDAPVPAEEEKKEKSLAAMMKATIAAQVSNKVETENTNNADENYASIRKILTEKACPHCHSILPEKFGVAAMHRIMMLGGTRSGKTTYMVAAANLLKNQSGLPLGVISGCTIAKESERYFNFLIECMEYGKLETTPLDNASVTRFVFPIVVNVTALNEAQEEHEFILIINDIPGEAMRDKDFLMNYCGLLEADAGIMLIDPLQFVPALDTKREMAREDLQQRQGSEAAIDDSMVKKHLEQQFTPYPFLETFKYVKAMIAENDFYNLRCFSMVLNKFDLLYAGRTPFIDQNVANSLTRIHGIHNLGQIKGSTSQAQSQHDDGIDLDLIASISRQVVGIIEGRLRFKNYSTSLAPIGMKTGEVVTLCTSVRNWNAAEGNFFNPIVDGKAEAEDIIGFRLLEPILYVLAKTGLLITKQSGFEPEPELESEPPRGWWKRLFSKD